MTIAAPQYRHVAAWCRPDARNVNAAVARRFNKSAWEIGNTDILSNLIDDLTQRWIESYLGGEWEACARFADSPFCGPTRLNISAFSASADSNAKALQS